jgi:hypothetical protein
VRRFALKVFSLRSETEGNVTRFSLPVREIEQKSLTKNLFASLQNKPIKETFFASISLNIFCYASFGIGLMPNSLINCSPTPYPYRTLVGTIITCITIISCIILYSLQILTILLPSEMSDNTTFLLQRETIFASISPVLRTGTENEQCMHPICRNGRLE